jgi:hypothetical protein
MGPVVGEDPGGRPLIEGSMTRAAALLRRRHAARRRWRPGDCLWLALDGRAPAAAAAAEVATVTRAFAELWLFMVAAMLPLLLIIALILWR